MVGDYVKILEEPRSIYPFKGAVPARRRGRVQLLDEIGAQSDDFLLRLTKNISYNDKIECTFGTMILVV